MDIIFILVCSTTKGDIFPFQFPVLLHVGSFLSLPHTLLPLASLPLPLSLSEEEAGSGKFTSCQAEPATGSEETAAAKEEEEKGREVVMTCVNFITFAWMSINDKF